MGPKRYLSNILVSVLSWPVLLGIFSCASWQCVYLLWRSACSGSLPILISLLVILLLNYKNPFYLLDTGRISYMVFLNKITLKYFLLFLGPFWRNFLLSSGVKFAIEESGAIVIFIPFHETSLSISDFRTTILSLLYINFWIMYVKNGNLKIHCVEIMFLLW